MLNLMLKTDGNEKVLTITTTSTLPGIVEEAAPAWRDIFEMLTHIDMNFEDGTCTCADFKNRGETCKHFYRIVFEKAIA